jgi:hypothetical protein
MTETGRGRGRDREKVKEKERKRETNEAAVGKRRRIVLLALGLRKLPRRCNDCAIIGNAEMPGVLVDVDALTKLRVHVHVLQEMLWVGAVSGAVR